MLQGFSLLFKDVLFGFFNIQKDKINEYFIINLLLLHRIHRRKFTHKKITHKKEVQQYIQTISSSKNLKEFYFINWEKNNPLSLCLSMHTSIWD